MVEHILGDQGQIVGREKIGTGEKKEVGEETSRAKRIAICLALDFSSPTFLLLLLLLFFCFVFFHLFRFSLSPLSAPGSPRMGLAVAAGCWPDRMCGRICKCVRVNTKSRMRYQLR